ncbi:hypothetical protein KFE25_009697 [Diacronema lutheri]|uniref:Metallo-beta-lactamase domain-containing protein n=1 Tax=Diacronema lutheri TaxID=2081491 RepID=A0A8J6CHL7_DIALT|nr:hypothetical protein KFE25_009697 [Diacronema lutheri]
MRDSRGALDIATNERPRWALVRARDGASNGRALRWTESGEDVEILVDYFPPAGRARCLVLTHCHEDHRRGLEALMLPPPAGGPEQSECQRNRVLYCTALTRTLLLARAPVLKAVAERIVALPACMAGGGSDGSSSEGEDGTVEGDEAAPMAMSVSVGSGGRCATLTAYDAGHCAGSAAVRIEASFGAALFSGDFRWDDPPRERAAAPLPGAHTQRSTARCAPRAAPARCELCGDGDECTIERCARLAGVPRALRARARGGGGGGAQGPPPCASPGAPRAALDLLVLDTTCATAELRALPLPSRALALKRAAARAAAYGNAREGSARVWVDVSTLGQEPLLAAVARALDPTGARVVLPVRPDDSACGKTNARLRELWDLHAAEERACSADAPGGARARHLPVQLLSAQQAADMSLAVRTHAWLRRPRAAAGREAGRDEFDGGRHIAPELLAGGVAAPTASELMLSGTTLWWALDAERARVQPCARGEGVVDGDGVTRVPFSMHAPAPAVRALARALDPTVLEPLVLGGRAPRAADGVCELEQRRALCAWLGRTPACAERDARASEGGQGVPPASWRGAVRRGAPVGLATDAAARSNATDAHRTQRAHGAPAANDDPPALALGARRGHARRALRVGLEGRPFARAAPSPNADGVEARACVHADGEAAHHHQSTHASAARKRQAAAGAQATSPRDTPSPSARAALKRARAHAGVREPALGLVRVGLCGAPYARGARAREAACEAACEAAAIRRGAAARSPAPAVAVSAAPRCDQQSLALSTSAHETASGGRSSAPLRDTSPGRALAAVKPASAPQTAGARARAAGDAAAGAGSRVASNSENVLPAA